MLYTHAHTNTQSINTHFLHSFRVVGSGSESPLRSIDCKSGWHFFSKTFVLHVAKDRQNSSAEDL